MSIPKAEYVTEQLAGSVWQQGAVLGLSPAPSDAPAEAQVLHSGLITLRYGVSLLRSPGALIVGLFMAEMGGVKTGLDAWQWLWSKFQLYPRAEVIGISSAGQEAHLYVRDLDFAVPAQVFAYPDADTLLPLAQLHQLHNPAAAPLPPLLATYLGS